ncbi:hypothetical protein C2E23DRAFT_100496 [Lenzites betulinus]|nr:hypothetical protein C2E23DRAFT_100496 [Lenzites betulinus]
MLYACATCQGAEASIVPWYIASENCSFGGGSFVSPEYTQTLPSGTSIPFWAYQDTVATTGHLDISTAKAQAQEEQPDATTAGFYNPNSPVATGSPEASVDDQPDDRPSIGVIVGAAVGGSVGATLLILAAVFLVRNVRRRRRAGAAGPDVPPKERRGIFRKSSGQGSSAKLYNPDDPTTYPPLEKVEYGTVLGPQVTSKGASDLTYPGRSEL